MQYIDGKGKKTNMYETIADKLEEMILTDAISIDENDIEIGVTTDAVGGSVIVLTPDKIAIDTPKLTYNGSEVATTSYIDNLILTTLNKAV